MAVEFPFVEVGPLELAFPVVPNYDAVVEALPEEFKQPQTEEQALFLGAAQRWFDRRFTPGEDLPGYDLRTDSSEVAQQQRDYVEVWSGTYQPKQQLKIAVMGWLLSLAFEKSPD